MAVRPVERAQHIGDLADGRKLVRVACEAEPVEIPGQDGAPAQQWAQIMPLGPFVEARDGRTFQVSDPLKVAANTETPLLVDWEHESECWMGSTEAAGWGEELRVQMDDVGQFPRAGIWGRIEWTTEGSDDVKGKAYRFLSPVLLMDSETRDVERIVSVALTNRPALPMQGLDAYRQRFSAQFGQLHEGERKMKPETLKLLLAALSLAEGATDEQIVAAFNAKTKPQPQAGAISAEAYAQLTNQLTAATGEVVALKQKLTDLDKATFAAEVKTVLDGASQAGKIPPAARAGYEAICATREGFQVFTTSILPNLVTIGAPAPKSPAAPGKNEGFRASLKAKGWTDERINAAMAVPTNGVNADQED